MKALILVDIQHDFLPGGALAVPRGDEVIPLANRLQAYFHLVVATQDWHPSNHLSFASQHAGKRPGEMIDLRGAAQVLWPDHCIQGTRGAALANTLHQSSITRVFTKGEDREIDSYSGFFDNDGKRETGLGRYLRERKVTEAYILGLATDYCVRATAIDSCRLGFATHLIEDACRGVELRPGDCEYAIAEMVQSGVKRVHSDRWLAEGHDREEASTRSALHQGRFIHLMQTGRWEYAQRSNAKAVVVIVPITQDDELIFIEQYREPMGKRCIEFPAGLVGDNPDEENEDQIEAVRRELIEETGFDSDQIRFVATSSASAGLTNETHSVYVATGLRQVSEGGGIDGEQIQLHRVPRAKAAAWLAQRRADGLDVAMSVYGSLWLADHGDIPSQPDA